LDLGGLGVALRGMQSKEENQQGRQDGDYGPFLPMGKHIFSISKETVFEFILCLNFLEER
jgi:hypothetical protein